MRQKEAIITQQLIRAHKIWLEEWLHLLQMLSVEDKHKRNFKLCRIKKLKLKAVELLSIPNLTKSCTIVLILTSIELLIILN